MKNIKSWPKELKQLAYLLGKVGVRWRIASDKTLKIVYHDGKTVQYAFERKPRYENRIIYVHWRELPFNINIAYKSKVFCIKYISFTGPYWYYTKPKDAIKAITDHLNQKGGFQKGGYCGSKYKELVKKATIFG